MTIENFHQSLRNDALRQDALRQDALRQDAGVSDLFEALRSIRKIRVEGPRGVAALTGGLDEWTPWT